MVRGASVGLVRQAALKDFGADCSIARESDATAAIAIASRRGLGKVRHIEVCQLWLQERVRRGEVKTVKVGTRENVADALTKYVSKDGVLNRMNRTSQNVMGGRHELALATECYQELFNCVLILRLISKRVVQALCSCLRCQFCACVNLLQKST